LCRTYWPPLYAYIRRDGQNATEAAVKSAVQRMRQRHRELLREEIAQTVSRPQEIEEELRHFRVLLGGARG
jgi:hypothetical protein